MTVGIKNRHLVYVVAYSGKWVPIYESTLLKIPEDQNIVTLIRCIPDAALSIGDSIIAFR
jgi:hypothetical protein